MLNLNFISSYSFFSNNLEPQGTYVPMLVLLLPSCEDLEKVNSLHFNSVVVNAVGAQPPYSPAHQSSNFTHKVPALFISVWAYSAVLRLKAEVCGGVGELTPQSNPQLMRDGRQSSDEIIMRYAVFQIFNRRFFIIFYLLCLAFTIYIIELSSK